MTNLYPTISESQRFGRDAESAFVAQRPQEWLDAKRPSSDDFGVDYDVAVADSTFQFRRTFRVQLKGTRSPVFVDGGTHISVKLKASNVRFYNGIIEPMLLMFCDLSVAPDAPWLCPVHYVWLHEELRRIEADRLPDAQTWVNVRVPRSNVLSRQTDILSYLDREALRGKTGGALARVLERKRPTAEAEEIDRIMAALPDGFQFRSHSLFDAIASEPQSPWPDPPPGTVAWRLAHASSELAQGDVAAAVRHLDSVSPSDAEPMESAEYWGLRGKLNLIEGSHGAAAEAFAEAMRLQPTPTRVAAWAEAELKARRSRGRQANIGDLLAKLDRSDPVAAGTRARVLAAAGRLDEAWQEACACDGPHGSASRVVVASARGDWAAAVAACDDGLARPWTGAHFRTLMLISRANARYWSFRRSECTRSDARDGSADQLRSSQRSLLDAAWADILEASTALRKAGWPEDTEFLADAWAGVAIAMQRTAEALDAITLAAAARPYFPALQVALEAIAHHSDRPLLALEANHRQPLNPESRLRRVVGLYAAGKARECAELFASADSEDHRSSPNFGAAAVMAGVCARRLGERDLFRKCRDAIAEDEAFAADLAALEYLSEMETRPSDEGSVARARLEASYEALGQPLALAKRLLNGLRASDPAQASKAEAFAKRILSERPLLADEAVKLGLAFTRLSKWKELLDLTHESRASFPEEPRFSQLRAWALDEVGQTGEALIELRALLASGFESAESFDAFSGIAERLESYEEARDVLERALSRARDDATRRSLIIHLYRVAHAQEASGRRALDLAWRLGELSNREDEDQEGTFLALVIVAGKSCSSPAPQEELRELMSRDAEFRRRFPDSKFLPSNFKSSPEHMRDGEVARRMAALRGSARDAQANSSRREQGGAETSVPFEWRPKRLFPDTRDAFALWEAAKRSAQSNKQAHLQIASMELRTTQLSEVGGHRLPLLDLATLLILSELDMFDLLFDLFSSVAIGRATLAIVSAAALPIGDSAGRATAAGIKDRLRPHLHRVMQLKAERMFEREPHDDLPSLEFLELAKRDDLVPYTDDLALSRMAVAESPGRMAICTLDLIRWSRGSGKLTDRDAALKLWWLCFCKVETPIELEIIRALVPATLMKSQAVADALSDAKNDPVFMHMLDLFWHPDVEFSQSLSSARWVLRRVLDDEAVPISSVAAIATLWIEKSARARDIGSTDDFRSAVLFAGTISDGASASVRYSERMCGAFRLVLAWWNEVDPTRNLDLDGWAGLGRLAAALDFRKSLSDSTSVRARIVIGLTKGSDEFGEFEAAYRDGARP